MKKLSSIFKKKIIIFGTGEAAEELTKRIPVDVFYYVDNNERKWGISFLQKIIKNPVVIADEPKSSISILVASMHYDEIAVQLKDMGFRANIDFYNHVDIKHLLNGGQEFEPGHFYSPIPSFQEVKSYEESIFNRTSKEILGIELNEANQLELFHKLKAYYNDHPFSEEKQKNLRYYFNNDSYCHSDGFFLHSMIRHLKPKKIIEIGSGYSSCVILDTNEVFFENRIISTFIEPYPERFLSFIKPEDQMNIHLIPKKLQDIDERLFLDLSAGDILFIDSSHVSKVGSDVNKIFFEILPKLNKGVYIHFHDIFYPFEYPKEWVFKGISWNEAYILRAFLQYNPNFKIRLWNEFLARFHFEKFEKSMPTCLKNTGGSIWLEKI